MVIDAFMARYERERDYYEKVTFLCKQMCETGLEQGGIRAIVTSRAKRHDKLREKIQKRNEVKNYQSIEAIYDDIYDLAGVRIALYFPGDRGEVSKFINDRFDVIDKNANFLRSSSPYKRRFSGYSAIHYRVHLRENSLPDDQKDRAKALIEIQIATVLMHAWSEVEHDLGYKPTLGELSEDEYAILDEVNGLVLAGEIALERLQRAIRRRVERSGTLFKNQYELATYLYNQLPDMQLKSVQVERVDLLFHLLEAAKLNRPEELMKFISQLDLSDTRRTVSSQLIDCLLSDHPELYEIYGQNLPEVRLIKVMRLPLVQGARTFLSRWATLEAIVNKIARAKGQYVYITPNVEMLQGLGVLTTFDQDNLERLSYTRETRDRLIYETVFPVDPASLGGGVYFITHIICNLGATTTKDTKRIIDGSEEIQEILKGLNVISDRQAKKIGSIMSSFSEHTTYAMKYLYQGFGVKDYSDILAKDYKRVLEFLEDLKDETIY